MRYKDSKRLKEIQKEIDSFEKKHEKIFSNPKLSSSDAAIIKAIGKDEFDKYQALVKEKWEISDSPMAQMARKSVGLR